MSLLASLMFLDQAVSPLLMRELARLSLDQNNEIEARNTLRTLEVLSAFTAVFLGCLLWILAPLITSKWLSNGNFSPERLTHIMRLIGLTIVCQWPTFLYNAGFVGLQRQEVAMRLRITLNTFQWVGAALLLWLTNPRIEMFFYWQIFSLSLTTLVLRSELWRITPSSLYKAVFEFDKLKSAWRFALGSLAVGITGSILTQADKLLVAKYTSLEELAGYTLCFLIASIVSAFISQPINASLLPHFAALLVAGHKKRLAIEYHRWTQWVSLVAFPISAILIFFPSVLVQIWLPHDSPAALTVIALVPWISAGTLFNVIGTFPYVLQMAAGRTRLLLLKNICAIALVLPALVYWLPKYGSIVGAGCWLAVNAAYYLIEAPIMHSQLMKGELRDWWLKDTLFPGILITSLFFLSNFVFFRVGGWWIVGVACITALVGLVILSLVLPYPRADLFSLFKKRVILA